MIILEVDFVCVTVDELKSDAPVTVDVHRVGAGSISLQCMKVGDPQKIVKFLGGLDNVQQLYGTVVKPSTDLRGSTIVEEFLQSFASEASDRHGSPSGL